MGVITRDMKGIEPLTQVCIVYRAVLERPATNQWHRVPIPSNAIKYDTGIGVLALPVVFFCFCSENHVKRNCDQQST